MHCFPSLTRRAFGCIIGASSDPHFEAVSSLSAGYAARSRRRLIAGIPCLYRQVVARWKPSNEKHKRAKDNYNGLSACGQAQGIAVPPKHQQLVRSFFEARSDDWVKAKDKKGFIFVQRGYGS